MNDVTIAALAATCAQQQDVFVALGSIVQSEPDAAAKLVLLDISSAAGALAVELHGALADALGSPDEADRAVGEAATDVGAVDASVCASTSERLALAAVALADARSLLDVVRRTPDASMAGELVARADAVLASGMGRIDALLAAG